MAKPCLIIVFDVNGASLRKMPYIKRMHARSIQDQQTGYDGFMIRIFKFFFFLAVIGALGLVGFAYLGDLSPVQTEVKEQISLDAN